VGPVVERTAIGPPSIERPIWNEASPWPLSAPVQDRRTRVVYTVLSVEGRTIRTDGALTWGASLAACTRGGRIVTCGATTGRETTFDLRALFAKQIQIHGSYMGRREHLWTQLALIQRNPTNPPFRPIIDRVFELSEYPEAQRYLESGQGFGKVVCRV
jgi:D-arabinose 1-dehydrogenase-like Zn-dependent alcohol dehydrogenase